MNQLIEIKQENALTIFTDEGGLDPILTAIEKEARSLVPDVSTKKGRDAVRSNAANVAKAKAAIERAGKELADKQKRIPKLIDASRKKSREFLESLQTDVRAPLTEWEEAEESRVSELERRLDSISQLIVFEFDPTASQLQQALDKANSITIDDTWQEFKDKAESEKNRVVSELVLLHGKTEKAEKESAELERLRKEALERAAKEEMERLERESIDKNFENLCLTASRNSGLSIQGLSDKIKSVDSMIISPDEWKHKYIEAIEAKSQVVSELKEMLLKAEEDERLMIEKARAEAKAEAERKAKEAEEQAKARLEAERIKAENEKKEAVAKAEAEAEARELARLTKIEEDKEEERRRAANKRHRAEINNAAVKCLVTMADISEDQAKSIITLIAKQQIPNVHIKY